MNLDKLREEIKYDEGSVNKIYLDHLGLATFGIGHLVLESDPEHGWEVGTDVSEDRCIECFDTDIQIVLSDCEHVYPDGKRKVFSSLNKSGRLCIEDLIDRNPILIHAPIVKRNLLDSTSFFDSSYEHEDWAFWLNLATRKPRLRYLEGVKCTYNRRSGSRSYDLIQNLQNQIACLLKFRKRLSCGDDALNKKFDNSLFQIRKRLLKLFIDAHRFREAQDVLHKLTAR